MATAKKTTEEFDPSKLEKLQEPITVTVERLVNGQREPVVLPTKPEENVPGRGWSKDDVLQMNHFVGNEWAGAGSYRITASGSNGEVMKWKAYFPESKYRTLHEGQEVARPQPAPMQAAGQQPLGGTGWLGQYHAQPAQPPVPYPQVIGGFQSPWNGGNGAGWMQQAVQRPPWQTPWQTPPPTAGTTGDREQVIKLEEKMERERLENRYKEQLGVLGQQMSELKREMTKPQGESEEVKLLREQLARAEKDRSDDKFARMIEESNRANREMIQALQAQTREQIGALQQAISSRPTGPDPTTMLLVETMKSNADAARESARIQAEAQKEMARLQAEATREQSRNAIGPSQIMELMRSASVGQEQLASAYGKVWELMGQGVETILAAQGPAPHPALELVGQAAQGGLEVAQRYVQMKERSAMAAAQAQAATAQAQAQAAHTGPGQTIETPALEGADEGEQEIEDTEEELFGPALPHVMELRAAVDAGAIKPEQAGAAIIGGIDQLANQGIHVPILDLWAEGQLAQLVEVVLPDAKTSFVEHTISALHAQRQQLIEQAQAMAGAQPQG